MLVARRILVGAAVVLITAACGVAAPQTSAWIPANQPLTTATQQADLASATVVWGRVPYCNCFADSATTNVEDALKAAKLAVSLQELSPREGWLYFAITFDPLAVTKEQVGAAMATGGAEILDRLP